MSVMEDCRDYLRTGRCKYGASCKYNHPSNVQNGGGVRPLDPNEPLFPIRPNEPVCQYFMKHGTCKFGQACKFNHPPPNSVQVINVGQVPVLNVGGPMRNVDPTPQIILNSLGTDQHGQGMVLQFLPQRPDEPDCIYFLKNGRCKYGATCRYHHPIHPAQARKSLEPKPRQLRQPVQYLTQVMHSFPNQQGHGMLQPSDGAPMSFVNIDNTSYQIIPGNDGGVSYCVPTNSSVVMTEQGSSASSLASSYETAQEHMDGSQWHRSKRHGSGGSLSAYGSQQQQQRNFLPHSVSEGNMARRVRSDSYGASSDHGMHQLYESASNPPGLRRNGSVGSWTQRLQGTHFITRQDHQEPPPPSGRLQASSLSAAQHRFIRRRSARSGDGGDGNDQGFTMMTSALLHMLDTPEEAASADSYSDDEYRQHVSDQHYQDFPRHQVDESIFERMSLLGPSADHQQQYQQAAHSIVDPSMFKRFSFREQQAPQTLNNSSSLPSPRSQDTWSPTWRESSTHQDDEPLHSMAMMMHQQPHAPGPSNSSHDSDVGLYLP